MFGRLMFVLPLLRLVFEGSMKAWAFTLPDELSKSTSPIEWDQV